jgi:hypothetical protein
VNPRYQVRQKVVIRPSASQSPDPRGSTLDKYAGQVGTIIDYYWVSTHLSGIFYIYSVKVGPDNKEIVVHEDEIEGLTSVSSKGGK